MTHVSVDKTVNEVDDIVELATKLPDDQSPFSKEDFLLLQQMC